MDTPAPVAQHLSDPERSAWRVSARCPAWYAAWHATYPLPPGERYTGLSLPNGSTTTVSTAISFSEALQRHPPRGPPAFSGRPLYERSYAVKPRRGSPFKMGGGCHVYS